MGISQLVETLEELVNVYFSVAVCVQLMKQPLQTVTLGTHAGSLLSEAGLAKASGGTATKAAEDPTGLIIITFQLVVQTFYFYFIPVCQIKASRHW